MLNHKLSHLSPLLLYLLFYLTYTIPNCGNGIIQAAQECDDGNNVNGDGCNSNCFVEPNYRCASAPSICKIDIIFNLTILGSHRITTKNSVVFIFDLNYQVDIFCRLNFSGIFKTSIPSSKIQTTYDCSDNILIVTIDYTENIENAHHSFQLLLASTSYFWYDSNNQAKQLSGTNCQLTYQDNIILYNIMSYISIAIICFSLIIGFVSIVFEKWIGLELIQTYQTVFFLFLLMKQFPYELRVLNQTLKYSNGFDDIFTTDYLRQIKLSKQLNGLSIQKQFFINFNISFGIIIGGVLVLSCLALRRSYLRYKLESQINRKINRSIEKITNIFTYIYGEIFIIIVLIFMLKIITIFTIQLSTEQAYRKKFTDQTNITLATISFLILFTVIIYIANWYAQIPDNLTENDRFYSLKFRNMKFNYPVIYLIYQNLIIYLVAIYYHQKETIYIVLSLQMTYFLFLLWLWPYNTLRKFNRILHNCSILYNQIICLLTSIIIIRWTSIVNAGTQLQSNTESSVYFFLISFLLIIAVVLTVCRLAIFNKDVDCLQMKDRQDEIGRQKFNVKNDEVQRLMIEQNNENKGRMIEVQRLQDSIMRGKEGLGNGSHRQNQPDHFNRFLNDKYVNWVKQNNSGIPYQKKTFRNTKTGSKKYGISNNPLKQYLQMQRNMREQNYS